MIILHSLLLPSSPTLSLSALRVSLSTPHKSARRKRSNELSNSIGLSNLLMIMQTIIHNLSFCSFHSTIIDPKPRFQFSSFVTLPPTYSVQQKLYTRGANKQFVAVCAASSDVETSSKDESVLITTAETGNSNEVKVHVQVSGEKTQKLFNHVFEKMVAAAQPIPGFRRVKGGKTPNIPRDVLLEILGYSKVYRQVIKRLINSAIEDYVKQEDLKVGNDLTVEQSYEDLEETFESGESFSFDAIIKLQEVN